MTTCRSEEGVGKCGINTGTFTWAIAFLEKDVTGSSFQQSGVGSDIRKVGMNSNRISDDERSTLLSSLSGDDRQGHATQSDETIVDARKAEEDCNTNHAELIAAEKK